MTMREVLAKEAIEALLNARDQEWQKAWNGPNTDHSFGPKTPEELRVFREESERVHAEVRKHMTTRTAPESPCTCAEIQRKDPLRHFRECPLREDLPAGHPQADRPEHHYSGDNSTVFWDRVNALPEKEKDTLYSCGVLLQELEVKVLRWLDQAETCSLREPLEELPAAHPQAEKLDPLARAGRLFAVLTEIGHSNPAQAVWDFLQEDGSMR